MRIIEIQSGKRKLEAVAGLIWHPLESSGSARAKEVLKFAKAGDADLKVLRGDDSPHVGLAKKADGAKPGQISCAAVIADALASKDGSRHVLVAMPLPDDHSVFIFVAVRDGVILADGDAVGTPDEIRVRLVGDVAYGGWDRVVCPGEWGVLDAEELSFESFFTPDVLKNIKQWQLKETSLAWRKAVVPIVLLVAVAAGASYGWNYWQHKKLVAAESLRLQQEAEIERGQRISLAEPIKPWLLLPNAKSFSEACSQALRKTELAAGNWTLGEVVCEGGRLTVTWKKMSESAWISHLKATHPNATISEDGQSAFVTVPAGVAAVNNPPSVLPIANGLALRYYDLASRYGLALRIEPPKAPVTPAVLPGQVANAAPVAPPAWVAMPISVTASFDPSEVAAVLDYPGLRFTKIVYAVKAGVFQYQLTGVQYVRP